MHLRDGDAFEARNLERQMFRPSDLDSKHAQHLNKALIMATEVGGIIPGRVKPDSTYIQGVTDMFSWMMGDLKLQEAETEPHISVLVLSVDNDATRKICYDALDEVPGLNVAVIDPGNDLWTGHVNLWVRMMKNESFLHPREKYGQLKQPKDRPPGGGCGEAVESTPQLITANKQAATVCLHMMIAMMHDEDLCDEVSFDLREFQVAAIGEWIRVRKEATVESQD